MIADLVQKISQFCQKNNLLTRHDHLVLGVSGGPDSLCLLDVLETMRPKFDLTLTVAHLNHQLRGDDAQADEAYLREVAAQRRLPLFVESIDVGAVAAQRKQSVEEAARQLRYTFLARVAHQAGATKIAVGHHADDQVETVLMHFLRGTGLSGLRGMLPVTNLAQLRLNPPEQSPISNPLPPSSLLLIRPLLETSRRDIEAYCRARGLEPRQDFSNQDTTYFRNRLRHELIPQLETYNPNIRQTLQRTAKVMAAETEFLQAQLELAWQTIVHSESAETIELDLAAWRNLPLALKRSTLRHAVHTLRRSLRDINFEHIEAAVNLIETGSVGAKATLPQGLMLTLGYQTFAIAPEHGPSDSAWPDRPFLWQSQPLALDLPGVTPLPDTHWQLTAAFLRPDQIQLDHFLKQVDPWEAYLDADVVGPQPVLRPRRPGDVFTPLGLGGRHQKVNEFMINKKIPAAWRNFVPLLVAAEQVLWLCGYSPDESACLHPATRRVLHLKFEPQ
ncbi:MAG: tRNA lysidine(34) synthetase TilS [Anaerolineales bacterium]|nr:tRNA lysidine(34) synthetase TilS [Anaerolineales bacterium]